MRAWEVRGDRLGLHEVEPALSREGETYVRVSHVGICGSDVPKLLHPNKFALPEPWRPGHEIVGVDPEARPVAVDPLVPCGTCRRCAVGNTHLCASLRRIGWDLPGGPAEGIAVPATNAHPLPNNVDPLHAVLADPTAVAIHGLRCNSIITPGTLAVVGAGTVGLLTALYGHWQGWDATVIHREDRPPPDSVAEAIPARFRSPSALTLQPTFDVVVDAAIGADAAPLDFALRIVNDGGTIIVQNAYHPGVRLPTDLRDIFRRSIRLIGSFSYCRRRPDDFTLALDLLSCHAEQVARLVATAGELAELPALLDSQRMPSVRQVVSVRVATERA